MTSTNKIIAVVLVVALLIMGVGYAAISNITLEIKGSATADPSQANFTVKFSESADAITVDKSGITQPALATVTGSRTDATHAAITVNGLTAKGDTATVTYTIQNTSADLSADLTAIATNSNTEYFSVSYGFGSSKTATANIAKGGATTVTVTVTLIKTPITASETSTIGLTITAKPVQPTV